MENHIFISDDFLLESQAAQKLYHEYAEPMPIIDYHCHLPASDIAADQMFENITRVWLGGDHYKWRAMRTCGIDEKYITGDASDEEKFKAWATVVPRLVRNPLYHWTHLELKRIFGIDEILNPDTASDIYNRCNELLHQRDFSVRSILEKFKVEALCTTNYPAENLEHHKTIRDTQCKTIVLPCFRPDKALDAHLPEEFNNLVNSLERLTGLSINSFEDFTESLWKRHQFFHENGCRISDYGIETAYSADWTIEEVNRAFVKVRSGHPLERKDLLKFRSAVLYELLLMDYKQEWVQQLHLGAMRNNNSRMMTLLGPDSGYDSIGDFEQGMPLVKLLDKLDRTGHLGKTIIYCLNPRDNDLIASIIGCFQDGITPGKIQMGSAWWFNDHKDGMTKQIEALSSIGVLSTFVGMLTDSRSFLSYPRHEYFRRILCNILGRDMSNRELPDDYQLIGGIVQDICYYNAKKYFQLHEAYNSI
ncbi:MAG TPA: glucuronate isomerase [Fervidobacterium sp.]|uniref:glucuronate isomerase n=1 Tax=Acetomicrobium mobile TaxID=97477 RepID=UPI0026EB48B7|nr:glucuronate isomerase [Acetomicrobium mobile]HUM43159.1 glucuronate isomerase [Fervidobacterium sp.]